MIRTLAKSIREYKRQMILTPVFVLLEVLMEVAMPLFMADLIDNGIDKGNMPHIWKMGIILLACALLTLGFGILVGRTSAKAATGYTRNLRHDLYYKVQTFSFTSIDKFSTASLVTRMTTDVANVQMALTMALVVAARSPASLICALIMAFLLNARLSLIFLAIIPFLGCGLYLIVRKAHPVFEKVFETYDGLNNVVQENLNGIRVVKAFVREDHEIKKFTGVSALIYKLFTKAEKYITFNGPLMQFSAYTSMILIAWFGARLIVRGDMTTGDLTGMISYAMMILMSLMMFSMVFVMLTISQASAKRITEVLNEESALRNPEEPVMEVKDGSISFRNVNFSYSGDMNKLCLYDVDLNISSGETVGILGGTGTSKSTLVQLIPRLYDATSGTVSVGGIDVKDYDIRTLRNAVAMVLQKNELFSGTIKENLRWGNENASDEELREACRMAQADSFISEMPDGYDTLIERGGTNVSGGQKQRICIARALLKKPKILILDDSTSAVDTATAAMIRASLREYIPETTKIIIAQRVASVQDADKIIVMDDGRISAVGTHEELLEKSDIYREVFNSQQKGGE